MFTPLELLVFALIFILFVAILKRVYFDQHSNLPPSLPSLPVVGSLPFMKDSEHLPNYLIRKSEELGPIFTLKIGNKLCLMLNSFETIEEALVKNSAVFSGRQIFFSETYAGNSKAKGIIAHSFDAHFKYHQKLTLSILKEFGFGDKRLTETRVSTEVSDLIELVKVKSGQSFNPEELVLHVLSNVCLSILFAKRHSILNGPSPCGSLSAEAIDSIDTAIEMAPWLRFLPYFRQRAENTRRRFVKAQSYFEELMNDAIEHGTDECFVSKYIEKEGPEFDRDQLLFTVRDVIFASTSDVSGTILWALLLLANNQEVQRRVQKEMDGLVPRDRLPTIDDRQQLQYLEATILEVMRIKTLSPLSVPRLTLADVRISGYFIPAGTTVMPNLYAVHMNPKYWGNDVDQFKPERFLDEEKKFVHRERCIPFSVGRRSCLGEVWARQELYQFLSGLVQNFNILPPEGHQKLDDSALPNISHRPNPFHIRMISREAID